MKPNLRNRANAIDRPDNRINKCREVPLLPEGKAAPDRCVEKIGHSHVFQRGDRYGCCTRCGDEVLT